MSEKSELEVRGQVNNMNGLLNTSNLLKIDFNNGVISYVKRENNGLMMYATTDGPGRFNKEWKDIDESYLYGVAQASTSVEAVTPEEVDFNGE